MRLFLMLLLIFYFAQSPCDAGFIFDKKNYKENFLKDAINAEKRNNDPSAFHLYEKSMYYYPNDRRVMEAYAGFCARKKYHEKAATLYFQLFSLTNDSQYFEKQQFSRIHYFFEKNNWVGVKNACSSIPSERVGKSVINMCLAADEKAKDNKSLYKHLLQYSKLYPTRVDIVNKVLDLAVLYNDKKNEEIYLKRLSALNPNDNGIRYRLAGFYEKNKNYAQAAKIYEKLIRRGDNSKHVQNSYAYVLSMMNPKNQSTQAEGARTQVKKPLSGFKLYEKLFYEYWEKKDYQNALLYLSKMMKIEPSNLKFKRHKVDIMTSLNRYDEALLTFLELKIGSTFSVEDEKFLAFLYSKNEKFSESLDIIEKLIAKNPEDVSLYEPALEYSMASKNWDKALFYCEKLVNLQPESPKLLKLAADLYSIKKDFKKASLYGQKLVAADNSYENKLYLANLYMADSNFSATQKIMEELYSKSTRTPEVVELYINSFVAQNKIHEAYKVVRENNLLETKLGYSVLGDLSMYNKKYESAARNYFKATLLDSNDLAVKNKLAGVYRQMGHKNGASIIYKEVLEQDENNLDAKIGLAGIESGKKNFKKSKEMLGSIIEENPEYLPAKMEFAYSYLADNEKMEAIKYLNKIPKTPDAQLLKAQTYYDMNMLTDAKYQLQGLATKDAQELKYKIKKDSAITITPSYSFLIQELAEEFKLDINKFGLNVSKNVEGNSRVFLDYNVYIYSSGGLNQQNNVTHEFRGGIHSRPVEKWEYRADIGVKAFEFGGGLINTDSWVRHYFSDKLNMRLGFYRDNLHSSYISAVGGLIDGVFTGRVIDNKIYAEVEAGLPNNFYAFAKGAYGLLTAQNLPTNQYLEGLVGIGRLVYNNPRNKWINTIGLDATSYNAGYQYNLLDIYSSTGQLYGGYFSPGFFTANTANLRVEGNIKKWHVKYGLKAFAGIQNAEWPNQTNLTYGILPYLTYDLNESVSVNLTYNFFKYADVTRNLFMVSATFRGFNKNGKKS